MQRTNGRGSLDLILWFALLGVSGWWLVATWISWQTIPAALVYGTLYGSGADARWHEFGHRTAVASKRLNDIVYHIASFMVLREPISWRWSHTRHHAETIMVGRDPEIAFPRPMPIWRIAAEMFSLYSAAMEWKKYLFAVSGRLPRTVEDFVPLRERSKAIRWARIHVAVHISVIAVSVISGSLLPAMVVGLPSLYGRWLLFVLGATQHAGLEENVFDHRLNTRSIRLNPVLRFLYLNMNYHLEHHLFPSVPYHRLPELSHRISGQLPASDPNLVSALIDVRRRLVGIRRAAAA